MGTHKLQITLILLSSIGLLILAQLLPGQPGPALAQPDTPTFTAANPSPTNPNFHDPVFIKDPTLIPNIPLPDIGGLSTPPATPTFYPTPPWDTPEIPTVSLPETPISTLESITTSINLDYATPASIDSTGAMTGTYAISQVTNLLLTTQSGISGIVSYTNQLSTTIFEVALATDTLASGSAPAWYAPPLPRPMADIGWRFEQMGQDTRKRYSIAAWGLWMADVLALPVQLIKGLAPVAQILGPFGLFLVWILIMAPIVLLFRILEYLKNLAIQIFNFLFDLVKFIISFIPGVG